MRIQTPTDLKTFREQVGAKRDAHQVRIKLCGGTGCRATGALEVAATLREQMAALDVDGQVDFTLTGCHGFCERGPLVVVSPPGILYQQVKPKDAQDIVSSAQKQEVVDRLLYKDPVSKEKVDREEEVPFYKKQQRIVFGSNGEIDPTRIEDYIAEGGYEALAKALTGMSREEIIGEVEKSGLRGRGGGGFPTGRKWRSCFEAHGDSKFVICNADEGDPGAFMDRSILEGTPHTVLEGMIIGAYAIGADVGYVYVRHEYPLAVENLQIAIAQAEEMGLLGENILGTGFDFEVRISRGGGAFVCGESTALMASIEDKPGEPRVKHIHTAESGLFGLPTNLNNVETWANVPHIIMRGADWYSSIGTEKSKGTKIFSLVGKINNTGLVEVPMGMPLREIVFDIGGGIQKGREFKAVQTGGPSGGCIPEAMLDLPVDFESLSEVGSMMGSGGMIVMDERSCMVDVARYFTAFLADESCGKCVPCREGVMQMLDILTRITEGQGEEADLPKLEKLGEFIKGTSLCGLGKSAPNPVLSTIQYFRDEYETHIREKKCLSGVCKEIVTFEVNADKCKMCNLCKKNCPADTIEGEPKQAPYKIIQSGCIKCGVCFDSCPFDAIEAV